MSKRVNWFITDQNVTVNYDGETHIVKRSDTLATDLIRAIKEGRMDDVPNLVSIAASMQNQSKGNVVVKDGELLVRGVKVPVELAKKIRKFIDEGLPYQPLVKFAENLQANPSYRAVNELFQFLEKNDHPFTESRSSSQPGR
jgi:CO dehydrogenase/acetyl-CoA synthase beta subunit